MDLEKQLYHQYGYPKRVVLRDDQPHKERWDAFFELQYREECKRLGIQMDMFDTVDNRLLNN